MWASHPQRLAVSRAGFGFLASDRLCVRRSLRPACSSRLTGENGRGDRDRRN
jgi:hypothetical protein